MYFKDVAYILTETHSLDSKYRPVVTYTPKKFYCNVKSIGQSEFYQSATAGLKPEIKLEAKLLDLSNVTHIKYHNRFYKILRIYEFEDAIEITLSSTVIETSMGSTGNVN